jgi:hypothetical protein
MKKVLKIVGVSSQCRNGKDTLADYLAPRLTRNVALPAHGGIVYEEAPWRRGSFAAAVKDIFCKTFDKTLDFVEEWKTRSESPPGMNMPVREAMTFIGDGFRKIQPNIWIETLFRQENDPYGRVISDCRYTNEARRVKQEGGMMILLYRPGFLNDDNNGSEAEIRPYIEWCRNTEQEGVIATWDRYKKYGEGVIKNIANREFFETLGLFDLFLINNGTIDDLYRKVDQIVIPYIHENYDTRIILE